MNLKQLILNTHIENRFAVWNGKKWVKFMVTGNEVNHSDEEKNFWLVTSEDSKKEHKLMREKAQELYNNKTLKLL